MPQSLLFAPQTIRGVTSRNRIIVSPMCMYSATDGHASDYHLVHLGRFALGGAGIILAEATAVAPEGRISSRDLGLWTDSQVEPLRAVTRFVREYGAVPGIQLAHAGRKAACTAPWDGGGPLTRDHAAHGDPPWPVVGPTAIAAGPGWQVPEQMSRAQIEASVSDWAEAARRAVEAGFEVIELHGAHGYLLHSFQSAVANRRSDDYGGSASARMRYPLQVVAAVRAVIPAAMPLFYRVSVVDGVSGGVDTEETITFARSLRAAGVDVIDTSSGGIVTDHGVGTRIRRTYSFHTPYSARLRAALHESGLLISTVGMIVDPAQAEAVLASGDADLVALGREMLMDPSWAHRARLVLEGADFSGWHQQAAGFLADREATIEQLHLAGETPLTKYPTPYPYADDGR